MNIVDAVGALFLSPDAEVRARAEAFLLQREGENFPELCLTLTEIICRNEYPLESRIAAGVLFKTFISSPDPNQRNFLEERWVNIGPIRSRIRGLLVNALSSTDPVAQQSSARIIPYLVMVERTLCLDYMYSLSACMNHPIPLTHKKPYVMTLGRVLKLMDEIDFGQFGSPCFFECMFSTIISMVATGLNDVSLAALSELYEVREEAAIHLGSCNYCGNLIESVIIELLNAGKSGSAQMRQGGFSCLVTLCSKINLQLLKPYIETIMDIMAAAVKENKYCNATEAITFWSSVANQELHLKKVSVSDGKSGVKENKYCTDTEAITVRSSLANEELLIKKVSVSNGILVLLFPTFIEGITEKFMDLWIPVVVDILVNQEEEEEQKGEEGEEEMLAKMFLQLVFNIVGDKAIISILSFLEKTYPKWRSSEAATDIFGLVLEGSSIQNISSVPRVGFHLMLNIIKNQKQVTDIASQRIACVFELEKLPATGSITGHKIIMRNISSVMNVLLESCYGEPEKFCGALSFIAQGYEEDSGTSSKAFMPYYKRVVEALLSIANLKHFRNITLGTLYEVVRCSDVAESYKVTEELSVEIITRLRTTVDALEHQVAPSSNDMDREEVLLLQPLLCRILHAIIEKLGCSAETKNLILKGEDEMMKVLLRVRGCNPNASREVMFLAGTLANVVQNKFVDHIPNLSQFLESCLQKHEDCQMFCLAVGTLGKIFNAVDGNLLLPYSKSMMTILLRSLQNKQLNRICMPPIFSCFGVIAKRTGKDFDCFARGVGEMMQAGCEIYKERRNGEMAHALCEAFPIVLECLCKTEFPEISNPFVDTFMDLLKALVESDDLVIKKTAVTALGSLPNHIGGKCMRRFSPNIKVYEDILEGCLENNNEDEGLETLVQDALQMVKVSLESN
ncbi:Importin subunit beta-1 [Rhynchospora pubera]|uniref:Importin subunit beta-1 n=1 Tax=Rhynchospora pubera TaxID=906938 RepID=A0AAV8DFY0_9POAL|nr:Importin subunit beta-1 [Rhynchospora pubera]